MSIIFLSHTLLSLQFTIGEITNFMSVDCQRILDGLPDLDQLWSSPLSLIIAMVLLYRELGPSAFAGILFHHSSLFHSHLAGKIISNN